VEQGGTASRLVTFTRGPLKGFGLNRHFSRRYREIDWNIGEDKRIQMYPLSRSRALSLSLSLSLSRSLAEDLDFLSWESRQCASRLLKLLFFNIILSLLSYKCLFSIGINYICEARQLEFRFLSMSNRIVQSSA